MARGQPGTAEASSRCRMGGSGPPLLAPRRGPFGSWCLSGGCLRLSVEPNLPSPPPGQQQLREPRGTHGGRGERWGGALVPTQVGHEPCLGALGPTLRGMSLLGLRPVPRRSPQSTPRPADGSPLAAWSWWGQLPGQGLGGGFELQAPRTDSPESLSRLPTRGGIPQQDRAWR